MAADFNIQNPQSLYGRKCTLLVSDSKGNALDFSELHIKFAVKQAGVMTPNTADIRVYNLSDDTVAQLKQRNKNGTLIINRVILQGGYNSNYGVIFQGNIKQVISGHESATDSFVDLNCGDGDAAFNHSIVNITLAAGSKVADQVQASINSMLGNGVSAGQVTDMASATLPRGKVMWGTSRDYLRTAAQSLGAQWSILNEKVNFLPQKSYSPGEAVVITAKTGMIGTPQQTTEGINIKSLMNPRLKINGRVKLDNASIAQYKIDFTTPGSPANIPPPINADGVYFILVVQHNGDNRGIEWYTTLIGIAINVTTNPLNSVQVNYGN